MKRLLCLGLVTFFYLNSWAQAPTDTTLATYLKKYSYIQVSDTAHLPKSAMPYYANMQNFMVGDKTYLRNCYIPAGGVRDDTYILTLTLIDIAGIKIKKAYEEDRSGDETYTTPNGMKVVIVKSRPPLKSNLSGRDGNIIINKLSGKVSFNLLTN